MTVPPGGPGSPFDRARQLLDLTNRPSGQMFRRGVRGYKTEEVETLVDWVRMQLSMTHPTAPDAAFSEKLGTGLRGYDTSEVDSWLRAADAVLKELAARG